MAISCLDQPDCFSLNNNIVGISFKKLSNNTADTILVTKVTAENLDSVFVNNVNGQNLSSKNLPLNLYEQSTHFIFEAAGKAYDLKLEYNTNAQFVSEDCGSRFVITNLRASSDTFDSVRVVSTTPKSRDIAGTNIEVYRCPNTSRIKIRFASAITFTGIKADFATSNLTPTSAVTTLLLPLNTSAPQTTFDFQVTGETSTRKLVLQYDRNPDTLFNACGEQIIISGLTITSYTFTSAKVARSAIQDPNQTNIEIAL